jgi:hypothetical protein
MKWMQRSILGLLVAGALSLGLTGPAAAQTIQDGLVNVRVGDVTILEDVNIGVAAQAVANLCNIKVGPVAVLGVAVDRTGVDDSVCTAEGDEVVIEQN